jgi:hypothetical protein
VSPERLSGSHIASFIAKLVPLIGYQQSHVKKLEARKERLLEDRYQAVRAMASRA